MSRQLTYELVADGGTDRMLIPIIEWSIHNLDPGVELLEPEFVKRKGSVADYLSNTDSRAMLLFVHRDAEASSLNERLQEFDGYLDGNNVVPIIPVRMSEAWIAFDAKAIALAAGRPDAVVSTPKVAQLDSITDPKRQVEDMLWQAAGSPTGRRKAKFDRSITARRIEIARRISDYSPLLALPAFNSFHNSLRHAYPYPLS